MSACQPDCLLVLVTGIPGAGKSTFLKTLQDLANSGSSVDIRSVLCLDEFLKKHGDAFEPLAWRAAASDLFTATERALTAVLTSATREGSAPATPPLVFVEDNMPYRSMRERYWRLCRVTEVRCIPKGGFIVLLELRFTVSLARCLKQNEQRRMTQPDAWIPEQVIRSMHVSFDTCISAPPCTTGDDDDDIKNNESPTCWKLTKTTQPWILLTLCDAPVSCVDCVEGFLQCLRASIQLQRFIEDQVQRVEHERARSRMAEEVKNNQDRHHELDKLSYDNAVHQFDLALRACVGEFCAKINGRERSRGAGAGGESNTKALLRQTQALKSRYLGVFKQMQNSVHDKNQSPQDHLAEVGVSVDTELLVDAFKSELSQL